MHAYAKASLEVFLFTYASVRVCVFMRACVLNPSASCTQRQQQQQAGQTKQRTHNSIWVFLHLYNEQCTRARTARSQLLAVDGCDRSFVTKVANAALQRAQRERRILPVATGS